MAALHTFVAGGLSLFQCIMAILQRNLQLGLAARIRGDVADQSEPSQIESI